MFDPEKVERWPNNGHGEDVVPAEDFDQLLKLYREHVPAEPCYICGKEAKGSKAHVTKTKEPVCQKCWDSA